MFAPRKLHLFRCIDIPLPAMNDLEQKVQFVLGFGALVMVVVVEVAVVVILFCILLLRISSLFAVLSLLPFIM